MRAGFAIGSRAPSTLQDMSAPTCPRCSTQIQPAWDWCWACGFDPEGLRPAAPPGPDPRYGARPLPPKTFPLWIWPVIIVGLVISFIGFGVIVFVRDGGVEAIQAAASTTSTAPPKAENWASHDISSGRFRVDLPREPTVEVIPAEEGATTGGKMYSSSTSARNLAQVGYIDLIGGEVGQLSLDGAAEFLASELGVTITKRTPITVGFAPAIEVDVATGLASSTAIVRLVDGGSRFYIFIVEGFGDETNRAHMDRISASFTVY